MKKILNILIASLLVFSFGMRDVSALDKKVELSSKKYVKTLKEYIKKEKFDLLEEYPTILNPIKLYKAEKVGVNYGYLEPTLEKITDNKQRVNELIVFIENNCTNNDKVNIVSSDMLSILNDMSSNLELAYLKYNEQLGLDLSDYDKKSNLYGEISYFGSEIELSAYDYINRYNDRVDKVIKMYNQIKKLS